MFLGLISQKFVPAKPAFSFVLIFPALAQSWGVAIFCHKGHTPTYALSPGHA